MNVVSYSMYK